MPVVELALDSSKSVDGLRKYDKAVDKSETKTKTGFSKMQGYVAGMAVITVAALATVVAVVVSIAKSSIQAASDMQEVQGKFDVVFRDIGSFAEDAAARIAGSYGLSNRATKEYLSSIQDLLVPTGLARDKAAEMSVKFTELAVDLGSFNNLKTEQVIMDIQSALAGGSETMTKYGIDVKVAAVNAEILKLGLDTSTKAAERQARTVALLSIMQRDSADAMGDFARTTESYANQTKILEGNLENLRSELGARLLPAVTAVVKGINQWLTVGNGINKVVNIAVETVRALVNGYFGLEVVLKGTIVVLGKLAEGFVKLATPLSFVLDGLVAIGAIDFNPIKNLEKLTQDFTASAIEGFGTTIDKIDRFNAMMDAAKASVVKAGDAQKVTADIVNEQAVPAEQLLKLEIDKVTESAKRSAAALREQVKVANELSAWDTRAAEDAAASGVGVNIGGEEYQWINGGWQSQSGSTAGAQTIVNNFNTNIDPNQIIKITTGQETQEARL